MNAKYSSFISYRRNIIEEKFLRNFREILKREVFGVTNVKEIFFDIEAIKLGQDFDVKIYKGIETAFFFIPLWYRHYINDEDLWCARELFHALELERILKGLLDESDRVEFFFVLPIVIKGNRNDLPQCLKRKNALQISSQIRVNITNGKLTQNVQSTIDMLNESLGVSYSVLTRNKNRINLTEACAKILKPSDAELIEWIAGQNIEMNERESKRFPALDYPNE